LSDYIDFNPEPDGMDAGEIAKAKWPAQRAFLTLQGKDVGDAERRLGALLIAMMNTTTCKCCPSEAYLAGALKLNVRTVKRAKATLRELELIDWRVTGQRHITEYSFGFTRLLELDKESKERGGIGVGDHQRRQSEERKKYEERKCKKGLEKGAQATLSQSAMDTTLPHESGPDRIPQSDISHSQSDISFSQSGAQMSDRGTPRPPECLLKVEVKMVKDECAVSSKTAHCDEHRSLMRLLIGRLDLTQREHSAAHELPLAKLRKVRDRLVKQSPVSARVMLFNYIAQEAKC
jgi:hypothetical protein